MTAIRHQNDGRNRHVEWLAPSRGGVAHSYATSAVRCRATRGACLAYSGDVSSNTDKTVDLESRIKDQRAALIEKVGQLRGDVRPQATESRRNLKTRLIELEHILKWGVADGWQSVTPPVANKLEQWLTESARQLVVRNEQP